MRACVGVWQQQFKKTDMKIIKEKVLLSCLTIFWFTFDFFFLFFHPYFFCLLWLCTSTKLSYVVRLLLLIIRGKSRLFAVLHLIMSIALAFPAKYKHTHTHLYVLTCGCMASTYFASFSHSAMLINSF